jgi:hypothetical protein
MHSSTCDDDNGKRVCVCVCVCVRVCASASASGESGFALYQVKDPLACGHLFPQSLEQSEPLRGLGVRCRQRHSQDTPRSQK